MRIEGTNKLLPRWDLTKAKERPTLAFTFLRSNDIVEEMPGRRPNAITTVLLKISTTERVKEYLETLVEGGLFGKNAAEAAERLITRSIEELLKEGLLARTADKPLKKRK